jgi:hypothetical protein
MSQEAQTKNEAAARPSKAKVVRTDNLRVRRETKKKIQSELAVLNKKDFGRQITTDDYVALAITLVQPAHLEGLRERSLSNKDRLEQKYQEYCAKHGKVSKDEFLGVLLAGGQEATV